MSELSVVLERWFRDNGPWPLGASAQADDLLRTIKPLFDNGIAAGWRLAHNEICELGDVCSRHQPIEAKMDQPYWAVRLEVALQAAAKAREGV